MEAAVFGVPFASIGHAERARHRADRDDIIEIDPTQVPVVEPNGRSGLRHEVAEDMVFEVVRIELGAPESYIGREALVGLNYLNGPHVQVVV